jgi:site-specific recombinase XerD
MSTPAEIREEIRRELWLEGFRDYLSLEAGSSPNTVESYLRDLLRLGEFARSKGVLSLTALDRMVLRDFIFHMKDLG